MLLQQLQNELGIPTQGVLTDLVRYWVEQAEPGVEAMILPDEMVYSSFYEWMAESANADGMTPARALGAAVRRLGHSDMTLNRENPFAWSESSEINESTLINLFGQLRFRNYPGEDETQRRARKLFLRLLKRFKHLRWAALSGSVAIDSNGVKRTINYGVQTPSSPGTMWETVASANIIANIQSYCALFDGVGGGKIRAYYGRTVANYMSQNAGIRDLAKQCGLAASLGPANVGKALLTAFAGNLEDAQMVTDGYRSGGSFIPFVPDKKLILVSDTPDGMALGKLVHTLRIGNGEIAPGPYTQIDDNLREKKSISVEVGCNSVPVLQHPQCVAVVQVVT